MRKLTVVFVLFFLLASLSGNVFASFLYNKGPVLSSSLELYEETQKCAVEIALLNDAAEKESQYLKQLLEKYASTSLAGRRMMRDAFAEVAERCASNRECVDILRQGLAGLIPFTSSTLEEVSYMIQIQIGVDNLIKAYQSLEDVGAGMAKRAETGR